APAQRAHRLVGHGDAPVLSEVANSSSSRQGAPSRYRVAVPAARSALPRERFSPLAQSGLRETSAYLSASRAKRTTASTQHGAGFLSAADDVIYLRPALRRDVPKSPFTPRGSPSGHRRASHFKRPARFFCRRQSASGGGRTLSWAYFPRWKITESCGGARVPGAGQLGCGPLGAH